MAVSINKCCRTCMKNNVPFVDIHETIIDESSNLRIAHLLKDCITTNVSKDDGLPHNLCNECVDKLQLFYVFRNLALRSEEAFKKLLCLDIKVKEEDLDEKCKFESDNDGFEDDNDYGIDFKQENENFTGYNLEIRRNSNENIYSELPLKPDTYDCLVCNQTFKKQFLLTKHMKKHNSENARSCSLCSQSFETETLLLEHMVTHTEVKVKTENDREPQLFPCPMCDLTFRKLKSLAMHRKKHKLKNETLQLFKCNNCGKEFKLKALLKRHMKLHEDRPHQCPQCPKKYSRRDQLMVHLNKHNGVKHKVCTYCNKGFSQLCSLKDHMRIHTGETPFLCSECGRGFKNSSNLRQHLRRHNGIKQFSCQFCPKAFVTKGQMKSHMMTHTGAHPFECEQCGAKFTKPNSLKKHQMIHLGVKPFACDNCPMRFTTREHLKRHYRIHTGEKPYRCEYCERAFRQSNDLVKHVRTHLGENTYSCLICGMRFRLQSELSKHYPEHYINKDKPPTLVLKSTDKDVKAPPAPSQDVVDNLDGRIRITFNSNFDKDGIAGDITIDIEPEKTSNI